MSGTGDGAGGTGTAGASGATGGQGTGGTASGGTPTEWTTGLNDDLKGYIQNKGFKDPGSVVESYRNLEKLHGVPQERLLKLPEAIDLKTPEGRAIFERLGAPKEAKDYEISIPPEHGDEKLADWFRTTAYENGFTRKQVEGLVNAWNARSGEFVKGQAEQSKQAIESQEMNLKKEWGAAFDQNMNIAKAGAKKMGITTAQADALEDALGFDGVMKLAYDFGKSTGEHAFIGGTQSPGQPGAMTPNSALAKINERSADKSFYSRLMAGDIDAKNEWEHLHRMAAAQA